MVDTKQYANLSAGISQIIDNNNKVPIKEMINIIKEKKLFSTLEREFPKESGYYLALTKQRKEIENELSKMMNESGSKQFGINNDGLCLVILMCQDKIIRSLSSSEFIVR
ncbi:MAG: hypothetical protein ACTSW1_05910 [Candidatus Hodarchaeales archaeon]